MGKHNRKQYVPRTDTVRESSLFSRPEEKPRDGTPGRPVKVADAIELRCSVCGGLLIISSSERMKNPMPLPCGNVLIGRKRYICSGRCQRHSVGRWVQAKDQVHKTPLP